MTYVVKSGDVELIRVVDPTYPLTLDVVTSYYTFPGYDPATYVLETED